MNFIESDLDVMTRIFNAAAGKKIGLMLDLDGATELRPPAIHDPVDPSPEYNAALQRLIQVGCPVAINTGRPEIFVRNLFPGLMDMKDVPLWVATETGAKIRGPNGVLEFSKPIPNIDDIRSKLVDIASPFRGVIIEDHKTCAITISMKHCDDDTRRTAYDHMLETANNFSTNYDGIDIISVWKGALDAYIELVPHGINKGSSTSHILSQEAFRGMTTIAFGDSGADIPMMAMTRNRDGISIGVGTYIEPHMQDMNFVDYIQSQSLILKASLLGAGEMTLQQAMSSINRQPHSNGAHTAGLHPS